MKPRPDPLERLRASHESLEALGIPHGLIGGWAVIAWGRVRATRDLDWLAIIPASHPIAGLIRVVPTNEEDAVLDILMKLQAGGGLDYDDAKELLRIQAGRLDETMLEGACRTRRVLDRLALIRR